MLSGFVEVVTFLGVVRPITNNQLAKKSETTMINIHQGDIKSTNTLHSEIIMSGAYLEKNQKLL
jgi:hypothetical protein